MRTQFIVYLLLGVLPLRAAESESAKQKELQQRVAAEVERRRALRAQANSVADDPQRPSVERDSAAKPATDGQLAALPVVVREGDDGRGMLTPVSSSTSSQLRHRCRDAHSFRNEKASCKASMTSKFEVAFGFGRNFSAALASAAALANVRAMPPIHRGSWNVAVTLLDLLPTASSPLQEKVRAWRVAYERELIDVPIVNSANNQHAESENVKVQFLWDGIETYAALMTM